MVVSTLANFLSGNLTKKTLLFVVMPLALVSYYGVLALAILLFPGTYDWRFMSVSKLLYPRNNPTFHSVASGGIVLTAFLIIPFAGYLNRRLRIAAPVAATIAATAFAGGAICLVLAGLVSSHPLHGISTVPRLHEILARIAGIGIAGGLVVFDACGVKGYFQLANGKKLYRRSLLIWWNLTVLPAIVVVVLRLVLFARFQFLDPIYQALRGTAVWHLGFWEWVGSAAVFLFLICSALLLPEDAGK